MQRGPGRKKGEKKYWKGEEEEFRRKRPAEYMQSRATDNVARFLSRYLRQWRNAGKQAKEKWVEIEDYLLGGKAEPAELLKKINAAQKKLAETIRLEESFLKIRLAAQKEIFSKEDWNALRRIWAMVDIKAELGSEMAFYGHLKEFGKAGVIARFAELMARLKLSGDREYAGLRKKVALANVGIANQAKGTGKKMKELDMLLRENKISGVDYMRGSLLAEYALAHQYFCLAQESEKLYACLAKTARDPGLKKILKSIGKKINERKSFLAMKKFKIEAELEQRKL